MGAQTDMPAKNGFDGRWFDDCIVASFDGDAMLIEHHCGGYVRRLTNWGPDDPTCPYADWDFEVCKKMYLPASDIPEGYKAMSQQDVKDYWDVCSNAMGDWDIISLVDGKVDGAGYGNNFSDDGEIQCDSGRWTFVMTDNDCSNDLDCPIEPVCPYADDTDVCKRWIRIGADTPIPDGYRVMSKQDVDDNWETCENELEYWDWVLLLDGVVRGRGYWWLGGVFSDNEQAQGGYGRYNSPIFLMADRDCEGSGLQCN